MKQAKMMRRQMQKVLRDNVRIVWGRLCLLSRKERWRLAWLLIKADSRIERAVK